MTKLSELMNQHTVTLTSTLDSLTPDDLKNPERVNTRRFHVTITGSVRAFDFYFYSPKDYVVKPTDRRYHPRYLATVPPTTVVDIGQSMSEDWWNENGYPIAPQLAEVAGYLADLSFTMQPIATFEDFCVLKNFDSDSRRAFALYTELTDVVARLEVFLGEYYPAFLAADIDL